MKRIVCVLGLSLLACQISVGESVESTFLQIRNGFGRIQATLHTPKAPGAKIAIVHSHPWGNTLGAYPAAALAEKGYAVLSFNTRDVNKDEISPNGIFENLLLDVAA